MDHRYTAWFRTCRAPAAAALWVALVSQSGVAQTGNPAASNAYRELRYTPIAQLPRYSASGRHECGSGGDAKRSCIVSGLFSDCNEAATTLRTRDCCPTTRDGGTSTAFSLSYCIPDLSGR
jgi:hypothetical protein